MRVARITIREGIAGSVCCVLPVDSTQEKIDKAIKLNEIYYGYKCYAKVEEV